MLDQITSTFEGNRNTNHTFNHGKSLYFTSPILCNGGIILKLQRARSSWYYRMLLTIAGKRMPPSVVKNKIRSDNKW